MFYNRGAGRDLQFINVLVEGTLKVGKLEIGTELRELRSLLGWVVPRLKALQPLAEKGAALKIYRWFAAARARRNWNFLRDYLTLYAQAKSSWERHSCQLSLATSPHKQL